MACWNSVIPYLCPDLPARQRDALAYGIKAPIVYTSILIRDWTSFQKLGVSNISAPGGYHSSVGLAEAVTIGEYKASTTPQEPMVLHLGRTPCAPGKPRKDQHRLGREDLLRTTFETFERNIRDQLGRTLAGGGFDPGATSRRSPSTGGRTAIPYNYNTLYDPVPWALSTPEDRAHVVGRAPFGRIAIANADAAGSSHTDAAIDMAHRAVNEILASRSSDTPRACRSRRNEKSAGASAVPVPVPCGAVPVCWRWSVPVCPSLDFRHRSRCRRIDREVPSSSPSAARPRGARRTSGCSRARGLTPRRVSPASRRSRKRGCRVNPSARGRISSSASPISSTRRRPRRSACAGKIMPPSRMNTTGALTAGRKVAVKGLLIKARRRASTSRRWSISGDCLREGDCPAPVYSGSSQCKVQRSRCNFELETGNW